MFLNSQRSAGSCSHSLMNLIYLFSMDNVVLRVWAGNIPVKHKALPRALKKVGNVLETPECYFPVNPPPGHACEGVSRLG